MRRVFMWAERLAYLMIFVSYTRLVLDGVRSGTLARPGAAISLHLVLAVAAILFATDDGE